MISRKSRASLVETQEMECPSLGREDPLKKEMATYSSILAWEIPWTEEPGRLQFTESHSLTHTHIHTHTHTHTHTKS